VLSVCDQTLWVAVVARQVAGVRDDRVSDPALLPKILAEQPKHLIRLLIGIFTVYREFIRVNRCLLFRLWEIPKR
jgi:hypothetical protein